MREIADHERAGVASRLPWIPERCTLKALIGKPFTHVYASDRALICEELGAGFPLLWLHGDAGELAEWLRQNPRPATYVMPVELEAEMRVALSPARTAMEELFACEKNFPPLVEGYSLRRLQADDAHLLTALDDSVQSYFGRWESVESALADTVVYASFVGDRIASYVENAVSSVPMLEVGVYTDPEFRRQGHAFACALSLLHHNQSAGIETIWGAVGGNAPSIALAGKLGMRKVGENFCCATGDAPLP